MIFFSSLAMMYTPQAVEPKYQVKAGMFAAAMLITGIFGGILFSFLNSYLIVKIVISLYKQYHFLNFTLLR